MLLLPFSRLLELGFGRLQHRLAGRHLALHLLQSLAGALVILLQGGNAPLTIHLQQAMFPLNVVQFLIQVSLLFMELANLLLCQPQSRLLLAHALQVLFGKFHLPLGLRQSPCALHHCLLGQVQFADFAFEFFLQLSHLASQIGLFGLCRKLFFQLGNFVLCLVPLLLQPIALVAHNGQGLRPFALLHTQCVEFSLGFFGLLLG